MALTARSPARIGRYEILEKLASGGMAEMFLARFVGPGGFEKRCAIKRVLPALAANEAFARLLLAEAKVAAMFDHPNLVQIFDLGQDDDGQLFIAMELVNGLDLRRLGRLAQEHGVRVPTELVTWVMIQALDGLSYAHTFTAADGSPLRLVHRDVTPHNILVSWDGAVKLVDFGIAQAKGMADEDVAGQISGKLPYMSPEQAVGEPVDARSDLFSLAVCFFEMLTGQRPFDATTEILTVKAIVEEPVPPLREPDVPPAIGHAIERALRKHPEDRFPDALAFRSALQDVLRSARDPVDRHALAAYLSALREGRPERFDGHLLRIPRSGGALGLPGPDPYAEFIPSRPRATSEGPAQDLPPPPAPRLPRKRRTDRLLELAHAATRRWRAMPSLIALGTAVAVGLAGLTWRLIQTAPTDAALGAQTVSSSATTAHPEEALAAQTAPEPSSSARNPSPPPRQQDPARSVGRAPPSSSTPGPASVPAPRQGLIVVRTNPRGLVVKVDGEPVGESPVRTRVPAGVREIEVRDARRGLSKTLSVRVRPSRRVDKRIVFRRGVLRVLSRPSATVFINGRRRGTTPLRLELFEGRHRIRLEGANGVVVRRGATVRPRKTTTVRATLRSR